MCNRTDTLSALSVQAFPITNAAVENMQTLTDASRKAAKRGLCFKGTANIALPLIFGALATVGAVVGARYICNPKYRTLTQVMLGTLGGMSLCAAGINSIQLTNLCCKKPKNIVTTGE